MHKILNQTHLYCPFAESSSSCSYVLCMPSWLTPVWAKVESNDKRSAISLVSWWVVMTNHSSLFAGSLRINNPPSEFYHVCGHTNRQIQNLIRGSHACFLLANLHHIGTTWCSVLSTWKFPHCSSLLTLYINVQLPMSISALFVITIVLFLTTFAPDIILTLFYTHKKILFIPLTKERGRRRI